MKKIKNLIASLIIGSVAYAQQPPQGTPGGGINWKRGGNSGPIGSPNIFGTSTGNNNPIYTYTNGVPRTTILGTNTTTIGGANYINSGYLGLNNLNPIFHLDINTPNPNQGAAGFGELLLRCRIKDDPDAYISFLNIASSGTLFVPTLMARQSNNPASALNTIGSIVTGQDIATNQEPVTRFFSAINYDPTALNFGLARANVIENRRLFGWYNGPDQLMTMGSNGHLGVGTISPGNRVEINSDFYDPSTGLPLVGANLVTDQTDNLNPGAGGVNATGFSGLRFSDLTASSNPYETNPGIGVLAVDSVGDVIYVTSNSTSGAHNGISISTIDPTKIALGNDVGALPPIARLLSDREIPMDNHDIYFTNGFAPPSGTKNRIGIGTTQPLAKLHVKVQESANAITPLALRLDNNQLASNGNAGGFEILLNAANTNNFGGNVWISNAINSVGVGLKITAEERTTGISISTANGTINNTGLNTRVVSPLALGSLNTVNFGVKSFTNNARINYAGYFESIANPNTNFTTVNYGVRAIADGKAHINYGVYASTDSTGLFNFAGYFDGNLHVIGNITASGSITTPSDQQFKTNINDLTNATDLINQLTPRTFNYDTVNYADFNFESDNQMGLIAQEVEAVIPTIVSNHIRPAQYDTLGNEIAPEISYKGVEYEELISLLIAGMQEQQVQIDSVTYYSDSLEQVVTSVNDRLTQLENCLSAILPFLCAISNSDVQPTNDELQEKLASVIHVKLSDENNIVLNQNVPNPFAERTTISFSIPETVQKAQINFYNEMGKLINSIPLQDRGNGQINVYANDLSTGVYTYSLVADGQIVATKRMVKQ